MLDKLKVNFSNAKEVTLDDYADDIQTVWNRLDSERSIYDTWLHTVNHVARFGEAVRRGRYRLLLDELADTVMWFLTFVGKLKQSPKARIIEIDEEYLLYTSKSLTDIVWGKYPNICPVCFFRHYKTVTTKDELVGRKCDCLLYSREVETRNELLSVTDEDKQKMEKQKKVEALNTYASLPKHRRVRKVGDLQNMFEQIYRANIDILTLESLSFHLLEEVGEVSDALIRVYTYKEKSNYSEDYPQRIANLESELADVVSWIFAICLKVKYLCYAYDELARAAYPQPVAPAPGVVSLGINFWEILWRRYGHPDGKSLWCPICGERICQCKVAFATSQQKQQAMRLYGIANL